MSEQAIVRFCRPADLSVLWQLNEAEVPRVGKLSRSEFDALVELADQTLVAERDDRVAGFVVAFGPGSAYRSPNYRWFDERGNDFVYVDRIVVGTNHRRQGVAGRLYRGVTERSQAGRITCEVNLDPPNPDSMRFHRQLGFEQVGTQELPDGKVVALLARPLPW